MEPETYKEVFKRLYEAQYSLNPTHFSQIFDRHPHHLWNAFRTTHESNLLAFFANLDEDNKKLFLDYLTSKNPSNEHSEATN